MGKRLSKAKTRYLDGNFDKSFLSEKFTLYLIEEGIDPTSSRSKIEKGHDLFTLALQYEKDDIAQLIWDHTDEKTNLERYLKDLPIKDSEHILKMVSLVKNPNTILDLSIIDRGFPSTKRVPLLIAVFKSITYQVPRMKALEILIEKGLRIDVSILSKLTDIGYFDVEWSAETRMLAKKAIELGAVIDKRCIFDSMVSPTNLRLFKCLIDHYKSDDLSDVLLNAVAGNYDTRFANYLLDLNCDINYIDYEGDSILMKAIVHRQHTITRLSFWKPLILNGKVDIDYQRPSDGKTALMLLYSKPGFDFRKEFPNESINTIISKMPEMRSAFRDFAKLLIENSRDINVKDREGRTALWYYLQMWFPHRVDILLNSNTSLIDIGGDSESAFELAVMYCLKSPKMTYLDPYGLHNLYKIAQKVPSGEREYIKSSIAEILSYVKEQSNFIPKKDLDVLKYKKYKEVVDLVKDLEYLSGNLGIDDLDSDEIIHIDLG